MRNNPLLFQHSYIEQPPICVACSKWVAILGNTGRCPVYRVSAIRSYERRGGCPLNHSETRAPEKKMNPLKAAKRAKAGRA